MLPLGSAFPKVDGMDVNRHKLSTKDLVNDSNYTLIIMWDSWCPPCRAQMPAYKKIFKKYHAKGLSVIAITEDWDFNDWIKVIKSEQTGQWIHLFPDNENKTSDQLGVSAIPADFLLKNGKVVGKYGGADTKATSLDDLLDKLAEIFNSQ